jgi:hypothetical protein
MSNDMFILLPVLYLSSNLDTKNPNTVFWLRIAFFGTHLLGVLIALFIKSKVKSDPKVIRVETPKPPFGPAPEPASKEMTVGEYDATKAGEFLKELLTTLVIMTGLHFKFDVVHPLLIQTAMLPGKLYGNNLVKIYLLGDATIERPFPVPKGPFGDMMSKWKEAVGGGAEQEALPGKPRRRKVKGPPAGLVREIGERQTATVEEYETDSEGEDKKDEVTKKKD